MEVPYFNTFVLKELLSSKSLYYVSLVTSKPRFRVSQGVSKLRPGRISISDAGLWGLGFVGPSP